MVPFGCGVLVLLTEKERSKFKSRCALMLFVHYADAHPLYTYAVYSPRTRKVLMRQDCIFLTKLFPMRISREMTCMASNGEEFNPIRSLRGTRIVDPELSFADWSPADPLPPYEDHVTKWKLRRPADSELISIHGQRDPDAVVPVGGSDKRLHYPSHPDFGATSAVPVNYPRSDNLVGFQPGRLHITSKLATSPDPELDALYQQVFDLKERIVAQWVALLASSPSAGIVPVSRDDPDDTDELDDGSSAGMSSSIHDVTTRGALEVTSNLTEPISSEKGGHSQVDSTVSGEPDIPRRVSSRRPVPRIPYAGGSGRGLASKDRDQNLVKRPTNQRWFYDSTPASVPTLAFDPPRALNCSDHVTRHAFFQIMNPPDSDESDDSELNGDELIDHRKYMH